MTESEWLHCTVARKMLLFLLGGSYLRVQDVESFPHCRGSDRKLRLFACACYHRIRQALPDARARAAVEVAEQVIDGIKPIEELERAGLYMRALLDALEGPWRASRGAEREALSPTYEALALAGVILWRQPQKAAYYASSNAYLSGAVSRRVEEQAQTDLLRCIFGPLPFRSVSLAPSWLAWQDALLRRLAEAAYQERLEPSGRLDPDRLSVLADALEEAGCDNQEILGHLRGPGPHVRGCWPVDLCRDQS
jgi:hypothetical protein